MKHLKLFNEGSKNLNDFKEQRQKNEYEMEDIKDAFKYIIDDYNMIEINLASGFKNLVSYMVFVMPDKNRFYFYWTIQYYGGGLSTPKPDGISLDILNYSSKSTGELSEELDDVYMKLKKMGFSVISITHDEIGPFSTRHIYIQKKN